MSNKDEKTVKKTGSAKRKPDHQPAPLVILPTVTNGHADWSKFLEKKPCQEEKKKNGLFATRDIPARSIIPYYGILLKGAGSETYAIHVNTSDEKLSYSIRIDGDPEYDSHGFYIAAYCNEPVKGDKANCFFLSENLFRGTQLMPVFIVTGREIKTGEELTVHYGAEYSRKGYEAGEALQPFGRKTLLGMLRAARFPSLATWATASEAGLQAYKEIHKKECKETYVIPLDRLREDSRSADFPTAASASDVVHDVQVKKLKPSPS